MTRRTLAFGAAAAALSTLAMIALLLAVDIYLHKKYQDIGGLNVWGYRGPVVGRKQRGELRLVVLGGSTAFGFGVTPDEAFPTHLGHLLNARRIRRGPVRVVNLAYLNERAYSFRFTLEDYKYLDYDVALLYTGYNDLGRPNTFVYRRQSPVFRLSGYLPMLPDLFREQAIARVHGDHQEAAYGDDKTVFNRVAARSTSAAVAISRALERQLGPHRRTATSHRSGER